MFNNNNVLEQYDPFVTGLPTPTLKLWEEHTPTIFLDFDFIDHNQPFLIFHIFPIWPKDFYQVYQKKTRISPLLYQVC